MTERLNYQELLEIILKSLVNHPEEVRIQKSIDEMGVLFRVKLNPQDMGLVIGKRGATINAIKHIVKAVAMRNYARVNIKIEEPTVLEKAVSQNQNPTSEEIIEELKKEE